MSLINALKKNSIIEGTEILSKSKFFDYETLPLDIPVMNIAFSGKLDGGMVPGLTIFAGKSKHGKSLLSAICARAYMRKYKDAILIFADSEFGTPKSYYESLDIDPDRILHMPLTNVEELKHELVRQLDYIKKEFPGARVFIFIDSVGNLASKKEADDALNAKSVADMTRAKEFKSLTRIITPYLRIMQINCVMVAHTYDTMEMYSKAVVSGGCLLPGTNILMSDGTYKTIETIQEGDMVATLLGSKEVKAAWTPDTLENGMPLCYSVEFEDGYEVKCSNTHLFLTNLDDKKLWINAEDLIVGDSVIMYKDGVESNLSIKSVRSIGYQSVYDITVRDAEHYILENGVVTHNTGIYYSADNIFIMGRQQEKEGKEVTGFDLIMNVEKSRYCIEKTKFPIQLRFNGGVNKYTGLLEVGLEVGSIVKPSQGWYSRVIDGVQEEPKWRAKDTNTSEFWDVMLKDKYFKEKVEEKYFVSSGKLLSEDEFGDDDEITSYDEEMTTYDNEITSDNNDMPSTDDGGLWDD